MEIVSGLYFFFLFIVQFEGTYDSLFNFQAAVSGLQNQPIINAVIDGDDIIYRDYVDISIAVGTPKVCQFYFHLYLPVSTYKTMNCTRLSF